VFKPKNPTSIIGGPIPSSFENPSQPIDSEWKQKGKIPPAVSHVTDKKESGRFKFFNEGKSYGFLVSDIDGSDVFFHFDDMKKAGISEDFLRDSKNNFVLRFCFNVMTYLGKYNNSKKAVDLELLTVEPVVDDQAQMPQADYQGIMAPLMNS
jgi:cold shock CspA family protein